MIPSRVTTAALRLGAFVRRDALLWTSYRAYALLSALGMAVLLAVLYFVGQMIGEARLPALASYRSGYFAFVVLGLAQAQLFSVALHTFASTVRQAQLTGVFEPLLVTRTSPRAIVLYSSVFPFLAATARVALFVGLASLFFGLPLTQIHPVATVVTLGLSVAAYVPFGLLSAAFIIVFKLGSPVPTALSGASYLLGGVYFPLAVLPPGLRPLSALLPVTPAAEALRQAVLQRATLATLAPELSALALFAVVGMPVALWAVSAALAKARRDATLGAY